MPSILNPGSATDNASFTGAADGQLLLQTGPFGAKINALAFAADGTGTLANTLTGTTINATTVAATTVNATTQQQGGIAMPRMVLATSQVITTGVSTYQFVGLPSWITRITILLTTYSTTGSANVQVQLGSGGSFETSGYAGSMDQGGSSITMSTGFDISYQVAASSNSGTVTLHRIGVGNTWLETGYIRPVASGNIYSSAGTKTLAGTLDRVRISTSDAFDATPGAGTINILYEG